VYNNACIVVFDKSHVSITTLLVGHVLTAADYIAAAPFGTLIGDPLAILRDEIHVVIGAVPEDHLVRIAVEVDYYIRVVIHTTEVIPFRIELQPAIGCTEFAGTFRQLWQFSPFQRRSSIRSGFSI